ncbi:hypothetical protein WAE56_17785 [Iodobacter sp. LRB]|uniref:hypothetical protein n=1 Tax=unclassified Iodobacter TaxID=235634 RepID=UPI001179AAA7|nr:hypothetical protein [Iodobacter sp. BJB302]
MAITLSTLAYAKPVPLPDPGIQGYRFPENQNTLMQWINVPTLKNTHSIHLHGWGLWTSLTTASGETEFGLANVPVYLTWLSPSEIRDLPKIVQGLENGGQPVRTFAIDRARQHTHRFKENTPPAAPAPSKISIANSSEKPDTNIYVTMGYNPAAQAFATANNLFSLTALQKFYDEGTGDIRSIPTFPIDAVATKPTYKVIRQASLLKGSVYAMPAWPGTPAVTPAIQKNGFPESDWPGCVYINTRNLGATQNSGIDANCKAGPKPGNTYGLGDFIYYPITTANQTQFQLLTKDKALAAGDIVVLMAMHVTSREIDEWTWQTYFWTPNPAHPPLPSSSAIAQSRPAKLKGAAAHYAMAIGYQMVSPNQAITGGKSVGRPVTVYNPYLESDFSASVFDAPPENIGIYNPATKKTFKATTGVQSNCMTCHSSATIVPSDKNPQTNSLPYLSNFYVSRDNPSYKGYLLLDFLWSIQGTAK